MNTKIASLIFTVSFIPSVSYAVQPYASDMMVKKDFPNNVAVLDLNHDKKADSASLISGKDALLVKEVDILATPAGAEWLIPVSMQEMIMLDTNKDGKITPADESYSKLGVYKFTPVGGEYTPLRNAGITVIKFPLL